MAKRSSLVSLSVFFGCAALFVGVAHAEGEGVIFPSTSGDVADPIAWGGTYAETMTLPANFSLPAGTFYFSSNVTFASGYKVWVNRNVTIDQTGRSDVIVKLGGVESTRYGGASAVFKGGTYDIMGKSFNMYRGGHEEGIRGGTFTLQEGVVITNAAYVGMTATHNWAMEANGADSPTTLNMKDHSRLYTGDFTMGVGEGHYCVLNIENGGEVHATGAFKTSTQTAANCCDKTAGGWPTATAARSGRHYATVRGVGSLLDVGGNFWCGTLFFDTTLTVTNGGVAKVGGNFYTGYSGASNVFVKVTDSGSKLEVGNCYLGHSAPAANNTMLVTNGATLKVSGNLSVGEAATTTKNTLVISGDDTTLDYGTGKFLGLGRQNRVTFTDGAKWTPSSTYEPFGAGVSNVLEVTKGAEIGGYKWCLFGSYNNATYCTIRVADGGTFTASYTYFRRVGNGLVVSNGTYSSTGESLFSEWGGSDTHLTLQGTTPKVTGGRMTFGNKDKAKLRFEIPAEGYAEGYVPLVSAVTLSTYGTLEADVSAWLANKANQGPVEYQLMSGADDVPDEKIVEANEKLPKGCRFRKDGKNIYLRCAPQQGLVLIFR